MVTGGDDGDAPRKNTGDDEAMKETQWRRGTIVSLWMTVKSSDDVGSDGDDSDDSDEDDTEQVIVLAVVMEYENDKAHAD